jgi:hypothetical protein
MTHQLANFETMHATYECEESLNYNGVNGSLWVRRVSGQFTGRAFVADSIAGTRSTRADVVEAFPAILAPQVVS